MIGVVPTLRAELVRTRGSAAAWLTLSGVLIAVITAASGAYVNPAGGGRGIFMWQSLYVTGIAAPLLSLLAGLTAAREARAREGGTAWRAVRPGLVLVCRLVVLAGLAAVLQLFVFGLAAGIGLLIGLPVDAGGMLLAAAVSWAAGLAVLVLAYLLAEALGTITAVIAASIWQLLGTLAAEHPLWWLLPPTWQVRAMLPMLGIHANSVPLEPGDPLLAASPAAAIALSLSLAVLAVLLRPLLRGRRRSGSQARESRPVGRRSTRAGRLPALSAALRGRGIGLLCTSAVVLCALTAAVYPPGYVIGLFSFALLPIGSALVAAIAWQTVQASWPLLLSRRTGMPAAMLTWLLSRVLTVTAAVCILIRLAALGTEAQAARPIALAAGTVLLLLLAAAQSSLFAFLTVRFGLGWSIGLAIIGLIVSATFGGDILASGWMWILGPTGWPLTATSPGRFAIAALSCLACTAVCWPAAVRALRRAPARK